MESIIAKNRRGKIKLLKCPSRGSPELTILNFDEYRCENCGTKSKLSKDQKSLIIQQGIPCPFCGFIIESGTSYCGKCGKKQTKFCECCCEEVRIELDFCPKCRGNLFEDNGIAGMCEVYISKN